MKPWLFSKIKDAGSAPSRAPTSSEGSSASPTAGANPLVNILLVDDEPRNLDVLESILQAPDYRLVRAETADAALLALVHEEFACIVLDIRIPTMSGLELAKLIKTRRRCQYVPIIFLTAFFQEEKDILEGYDVGAVDYLTKPVNPQIFRSKVGVFVELFRTNRALKAANAALELEIAHRQKAEDALRESNTELEARVKDRTAELTSVNRHLSASERRYRELVRALPAAFYTSDAQSRLTLYNDAAVALWGREPKLGEDCGCVSHRLCEVDGNPLPPEASPMAATLKEGKPVRGKEIIIERPDGSHRHVLAYAEPIRDDLGTTVGAMNMLVDITERKHVENALRKSEERLRLALQTGRVGVWDWDLATNHISWTDSLYEILGLDPDAFRPTSEALMELVHPEDRGAILQAVENARQHHTSFALELRAMRPDGKVIWLFTNAKILRAVGKAPRLVGASMEITEQKEAEETRAHLAAIVESSEDAIISKNLNGIIRSWNEGAARIFGYTPGEAIGLSVTVLIPPERRTEEDRILETLRQGKPIEHFETVRVRKDGSRIDVSMAVSPVKDKHGRIVAASNITRDITLQKQAEQELERAHQQTLAASRAKDDFLAALSHELRTPLNPVLLLASEAAQDPALSLALREKFDSISKNVSLEARLIDDLLDLTRITRGKMELQTLPLDVHAVLQNALAVVRPELDQKQITLKLDLAAPQHTACGDEIRLQQVFWNVLKNAVKFTPERGQIIVTTRRVPDRDEISVQVTDTGIGMTTEEISRIFEPFAQGDHGSAGGSHRFGGLGLGLAISRKLMELQCGRIGASSPGRDQGATFCVELRLATGENVAGPPSVPKPQPVSTIHSARALGIRILLVEDHEPTRKALAHLLERRHYEVQVAASITEARGLAEHNTFHLLISDIGLPDGNGNDLMSELRAKYNLQGIALTGYGMEQDILRARNAGFGAHLIKPVRAQSLDEALGSVLPPQEPRV